MQRPTVILHHFYIRKCLWIVQWLFPFPSRPHAVPKRILHTGGKMCSQLTQLCTELYTALHQVSRQTCQTACDGLWRLDQLQTACASPKYVMFTSCHHGRQSRPCFVCFELIRRDGVYWGHIDIIYWYVWMCFSFFYIVTSCNLLSVWPDMWPLIPAIEA